VSSLTGATSEFSLRMMTRGRVYLMRKHAHSWALPYHFAMLHAEMFARMILKGEPWKAFRVREQGFQEGLAIPLARGARGSE
jgi:hypothetical protein